MFPAFTRSQIEGFGIDGKCNGKYLDLAFSLLLKVLIDSWFVFSLLQHRVLQLQHKQSNGSNKGPKNVCFLVRTFTKHWRHTWSACELGYFTCVLCIAAFALGKNCWYGWSWAGHVHMSMRHSGLPNGVGCAQWLPFFLSLSLSVFPLHMQKGLIDKSITDTRPKSHFCRVFFCLNNWQIIQTNIPQKEMKRMCYICVFCYFLLPFFPFSLGQGLCRWLCRILSTHCFLFFFSFFPSFFFLLELGNSK